MKRSYEEFVKELEILEKNDPPTVSKEVGCADFIKSWGHYSYIEKKFIFHRKTGPSRINRLQNGLTECRWLLGDTPLLTSDDAPFLITYNDFHKAIIREEWRKDNHTFRKNGKPSIIQYHNNGFISEYIWHNNEIYETKTKNHFSPSKIKYDESGKITEIYYRKSEKNYNNLYSIKYYNNHKVYRFRTDGNLYKSHKVKMKKYTNDILRTTWKNSNTELINQWIITNRINLKNINQIPEEYKVEFKLLFL